MCDLESAHTIVDKVLTRSKDGEQGSGTKYTLSGLAYQVYKKRCILQYNKDCAASPEIGDKSLTRITYALLSFLCVKNVV